MMQRNRPVSAAPLMLFLLLAGCNGSQRPRSGTTFILLDASASVSGQTRNDYLRYLNETVVSRIKSRERILLSPIGNKDTVNESRRLVDMEMPKLPPQPGNGLNDNLALEASTCLKRFSKDMDSLKSGRVMLRQAIVAAFHEAASSDETYLMDGFEMAGRTLKEYPGDKTLIVLSDGIEDNKEGINFKFDQPGFWKKYSSASILKEMRKENRIPNLAGYEIYFVGRPHTTPEITRNIRAFWNAYLMSAGVLDDHIHYGARPLFRPGSTAEDDLDPQAYCREAGI